MELQLDEVQPESNSSTYTISSINLKHTKLNCETENLYLDLTLDPSNLPDNDVYDVIHVNTTANPLYVNTTANPLDVNTTAHSLDATTAGTFDANTTANNLDVNTTADTLPVNNEYAESEPSWWRKKTSKWVIGAVTVAACVGVMVWIASEINWTRKEEDISKLTTNNNVHPASKMKWTRNDNNISKTHKKGKNRLQAVRQDRFIGFTAWAETRIDYVDEEAIRFTGVQLNEGWLYSTATGQFSCKVTGVYYIAVTLKRTADIEGQLEIVIYKGKEDLLVSSDMSSENVGMSITNSRLVVCLCGESLSMRGGYGGGSVYGELGVSHSTFTAFLMQETETRANKHWSFVGISAAQESGQNYGSGDTIEFSKVMYNDGGHFKPATNSFSCPFSGIYYVSVAIRKYTYGYTYMCVSKSTEPFLHIIDGVSSRYFSTSSNTAVIRCQQNETMVITGTGKGKVYGGPGEMTTFTVMLLQADGVKPLSLDVQVPVTRALQPVASVLARCRPNEVIEVTAAAGGEVYGHQVERHTTFSVIMMYHN